MTQQNRNDRIASYQSHRGLPPLAGLASLADAARPGLGVEASVARLKRYHHAFVRLHEILDDFKQRRRKTAILHH